MSQNYKTLVANFRPAFGNQKHLQIVDVISEVRKLEREISQLEERKRNPVQKRKDVYKLKRHVVWMMGKAGS